MKLGIVISIVGIVICLLVLNKENMSTIDHGRVIAVHSSKIMYH